MCYCKRETEARLMQAIPETLPEKRQDLRVSLQGYALMMGEGTASSRQVMPVSITYRLPNRAGDLKDKKQTISMVANYFMFCGEKYDKKDSDQ